MNMKDFRPQTTEPPLEDKLAQLTGFNQADSSGAFSDSNTPSTKTSPLLSDEELEEQITRHSFANSPLSKLVFVAGGMFVIVFIASLFFSQLQSPGEITAAIKSSQTKEKEQSPLLSNEPQDKEKSELLSELALKEQKEHLKALENSQRQPVQPVKTQPRTQTVSVKSTPVPLGVQPQPSSKPQTYPVSYQQFPRRLPRIPPDIDSSLVARTTQPEPTQLWKQLSQVGSFGSSSLTEGRGRTYAVSPYSSTTSRPESYYQPKPVSSGVLTSTESTSETPIISNDAKAISFGQSVPAVLQNTISWESSLVSRTAQSSDERYLVVLNQPLQDKSGKVQIPSGSSIVVRLDGKSNALVTLIAESVILNGVTTPLPQGVLKIRSQGGQPLIAQTRTLGGNESSDSTGSIADVLSVAGDLANIPGTRSLGNLYRFFGGSNRNQRSTSIVTTLFFLTEGTPLEVFVNKPFSLAVQEKPLELK